MKFISFLLILAAATQGAGQDAGWLQEKLSAHASRNNHSKYFIHIDRKVYTPRDKIWFQVYAVDGRTSMPKEKESVTVYLTDSGGRELHTATAEIVNGAGAGSISIPQALNEGIYSLEINKGETTDPYRISFGVRKKAVPAFMISLETKDEMLIPGTPFTATLRFTSHASEPIKKVDFEFYLNDGSGEKLVLTDRTDASGVYQLKIEVPKDLPTGLLGFGVNATSRGEVEILQGALRVASQHVFVRLAPEGGNLLAGQSNRMAFQAVDAYGDPFSFTGELVDESMTRVMAISSDENGMGTFEFVPGISKRYSLKISLPYPVARPIELPPVLSEGISIRLKERREHSMILEAINSYQQPKAGTLTVRSGDRLIWSSKTTLNHSETFEVPLTGIEGWVDCAFLNDAYAIESVRSILWKRPQIVRVNILPEKNIYQPREEVSVRITTAGASLPLKQSSSAAFENWAGKIESVLQFQLQDNINEDVMTFWGLQTMDDSRVTDDFIILRDPGRLSWREVLGSAKAPLRIASCPDEILINRSFVTDTDLLYARRKRAGLVSYENTNTRDYFLLGNADFLRSLNPRSAPRSESYKELLENGTPLRDVVRKMKPYDLDGGSIIFPGRRTSFLAQSGAIIVVDGIIVGNTVNLLDQINPYDVEKIYVSSDPQDIQRYTGLNSVGLIEVTMKHGHAAAPEETKNSSGAFESPVYREKGRIKGGRDFRNTIYWDTTPPGADVVNLTYYNGDIIGKVITTVILMDRNGRFGFGSASYDIRL